jgi:hypothetical protein
MSIEVRDLMDTDPGRRVPSCPAALLWILVPAAATAAWLRFSALGYRVMTPGEAGAAWSAWAGVYGPPAPNAGVEVRPASALLDNLLWLMFQGAEPGDALARAGPALVGSLLVLLPWLFRSWLGCWGSLAATVLLAVDAW